MSFCSKLLQYWSWYTYVLKFSTPGGKEVGIGSPANPFAANGATGSGANGATGSGVSLPT